MKRMVFRSQVGPDGVLHINVPIRQQDADREVQVTIDPLPPKMTQEEWRAFVRQRRAHGRETYAARTGRVRSARRTFVTYLLDTNAWSVYLRRRKRQTGTTIPERGPRRDCLELGRSG